MSLLLLLSYDRSSSCFVYVFRGTSQVSSEYPFYDINTFDVEQLTRAGIGMKREENL